MYKIRTDFTNKNCKALLFLAEVLKAVCLSVLMDIYLHRATGIACHKIKMACIVN